MEVDTLYIYTGSLFFEPYIELFCRTHANALQAKGIVYPDTRLDKTSPHTFPTHSAYFLREPGVAPSLPLFTQKIQQIMANLPVESKKPVSLCMNHATFAYYSHSPCRQLAYFYSRQTKVRRVRVFYVAMRQDKELEAIWAKSVLTTSCSTRLTTTLRYTDLEPFSHNAVLYGLQGMLGKDITVAVSDGSDTDIQRCLQSFAKWLGVEADEDMNLDSCKTLVRPSRNVLEFIQTTQPVIENWPQELCQPPRWENESAFLAYGQENAACGWYLRKQERDMFLSSYAADNARLILDNRLVSDPLSQQAFLKSPQQEMSRDHARLEADTIQALADKLQPQTRKNLTTALQTVALTQQGRTLRLCSQVLCPAFFAAVVPAERRRPKVTVLTLTYNHQAFIEQNIRSVCAQNTPFPVEHIILDNHSTDDTPAIIHEYAQKYPHIIELRNLPDPASVLFSSVESEYVCLCDGDDYYSDPEKLRLQAEYLDTHPECSLCFHPALVHYEDGSLPDRQHPEPSQLPHGTARGLTLKNLLQYNFLQTSAVMYRWRFTKGLPDWFYSFLEPADWYWHLLHAEVGAIGYIDRVMSVYRRHKNAMYADSEQNVSAHKQRTGLRMLETLFMLNTHFEKRYAEAFTRLALPIFSEFVRKEVQQNCTKPFEMAVRQYPDFAKAFYEVIKGIDNHD